MLCTLDSAKVSYDSILHGLTKLMGPISAQLLDLRSAIVKEAKVAVQVIV